MEVGREIHYAGVRRACMYGSECEGVSMRVEVSVCVGVSVEVCVWRYI